VQPGQLPEGYLLTHLVSLHLGKPAMVERYVAGHRRRTEMVTPPSISRELGSAMLVPVPRVNCHWRIDSAALETNKKEKAMNAAIRLGARFPDIELPDGEGTIHRLSRIQGSDPMAVIFYRGWF
jgi:hypothetical protein